MTAVEVGTKQSVIACEHVVNDSFRQQMIRHKPIEGITAVGFVRHIRILRVHLVIHLLGVCTKVVDRIDSIFGKNLVLFHKSGVGDITFFHI